jgi:hypothetical protein
MGGEPMIWWWLFAACVLAAIVGAVVTARESRAGQGRYPADSARSSPPPAVLAKKGEDVVWQSISVRYARHRANCTALEGCVECAAFAHVVEGLLARTTARDQGTERMLERDVARVLAGHVPDEAGLCRWCTGGHDPHSSRDHA